MDFLPVSCHFSSLSARRARKEVLLRLWHEQDTSQLEVDFPDKNMGFQYTILWIGNKAVCFGQYKCSISIHRVHNQVSTMLAGIAFTGQRRQDAKPGARACWSRVCERQVSGMMVLRIPGTKEPSGMQMQGRETTLPAVLPWRQLQLQNTGSL